MYPRYPLHFCLYMISSSLSNLAMMPICIEDHMYVRISKSVNNLSILVVHMKGMYALISTSLANYCFVSSL